MTPDELFLIAGRVAITGWLLTAIGRFAPPAWSARKLPFQALAAVGRRGATPTGVTA